MTETETMYEGVKCPACNGHGKIMLKKDRPICEGVDCRQLADYVYENKVNKNDPSINTRPRYFCHSCLNSRRDSVSVREWIEHGHAEPITEEVDR